MRYSHETRAELKSAATTIGNSRDDDTGPVYFWKENEKPYGVFCQWYPVHFTDPTVHPTYAFNCAEQYMMYRKALVIAGSEDGLQLPSDTREPSTTAVQVKPKGKKEPGNKAKQGPAWPSITSAAAQELGEQILREKKSARQKSLARSVKMTPAQLKIWDAIKFDVVVEGSYLKFSQHPELSQLLVSTGDRELLESSPVDRIWGVGFHMETLLAGNVPRNAWGSNLLGEALKVSRQRLKEEMKRKTDEIESDEISGR